MAYEVLKIYLEQQTSKNLKYDGCQRGFASMGYNGWCCYTCK